MGSLRSDNAGVRNARLRLYSIVVAAFLASEGIAAGATFVVTNANATGPGSLHQAIVAANATPNAASAPNNIVFSIAGAGLHKIDVSQTLLPDLTNSVTIDGYTQPGSQPNTAAIGSNGVVLIQVDGGGTGTSGQYQGFHVFAVNCTFRGLMITGFGNYNEGLNGIGIKVLANGCSIEGNFIGTDGTNNPALGNVYGLDLGPTTTRVGGNTPAARNVIGGNNFGIVAYGSGARISGNQIGTNPQEAGASNGKVEGAPNVFYGIQGSGSSDGPFIIGGTTPEEANLISGNDDGIEAGGNCLIQGNLIGLQPDRATPSVNQYDGIVIYGSDDLVGGLEPGAGNQIAFNRSGIAPRPAPHSIRSSGPGLSPAGRVEPELSGDDATVLRNSFLSNQMYGNSKIDIDLNDDGVSHNDLGDADAGSNNLQNFPVITSVQQSSSGTVISGGLNSTSSAIFTIQVFENLTGSSGQELLGTQQVTTNASGDVRFEVDSPAPLRSGSTITATATDGSGNTSEFSPEQGPVQLANISTRGFVGTDANILIGGFIVRDSQEKTVAVRALGPSVNVQNRLADPYLEIYNADGTLLAKNDDWRSGQQQELIDSGLAPKSDVESALIVSLPSGSYTAQVSGVGGKTGNGIVEIYDLDPFSASSGRLLNISTRGFVGNGDDVLIGGFIARGDIAQKLVVRAIGPDLEADGVPGALQDPTLELRDSSGNLVAENDDYEKAEVPTTFQPHDARDAVIVESIAPGAYTAIVRGKDGNGIGLVEFYDLSN